MFFGEEASVTKPRRPLRRVLMILIPFLVLGAAAAGLALTLKIWERHLDPPQGYASGEQLAAKAEATRPGTAQAPLYSIEGAALLSDSEEAKGAIVTAKGPDMRVSVYAPEGTFRIDGLPAGQYELTATTRGKMGTQSVDLNNNNKKKTRMRGSVAQVELKLTEKNPDPFPAAYYYTRLSFSSPEVSEDFRMQCTDCHQIGSLRTRRVRDMKEWDDVLQRMSAMGAQLQTKTAKEAPQVLSTGLNGARDLDLAPMLVPEKSVAGTRIREWPMGPGDAYLHGMTVAADGRIWAVDLWHDTLQALDPKTGAEERWRLPDRGNPLGGVLRASSRPLGAASAQQGPYDVVSGDDGRLWIACALGNEIIAFDPSSSKTTHWSLPRGSMYPDSLRVRGQDVWFTAALTNQLGHIDLRTNEVKLVDLPVVRWEQTASHLVLGALLGLAAEEPQTDAQLRYSLARLTRSGSSYISRPEGLDIHPDGSIWYSKVYDDRIGRYDPATGAVKEWATPFHGPRRLQIDRDGNVWIPAFGSSGLACFNPKTESFSTAALPLKPPLADRPYAVAVDPRDGRIWVSSTAMDVLYRYSPKQQSFDIFPLPTRSAYMRELVFSPSGEVCASYSNVPEKQASDQAPRVMCLNAPA
jgi:streptogramin lyase